MALRLIEAQIPGVSWNEVAESVEQSSVLHHWHEELKTGGVRMRLILSSEHAGSLLDHYEKRFSHLSGFHMTVLPVEAVIPRPEVEGSNAAAEAHADTTQAESDQRPSKIAREELYADVVEISRPTSTYFTMVGLSAIVAGIGILRDNTAIVIAAMVIAPLLGPNVALALATTLADWNLARKALRSLGVGTLVVAGISIVWGILMHVEPSMPGIAGRIVVGPGDIAIALAAGCAGVLSLASTAAVVLVGVMVAVALLPPLVTTGLLLGSGNLPAAGGAMLVFLTNVICINLAGVMTFLSQGIRPLSWWEARKARKATWLAIQIWVLLLLILVGILFFVRRVSG